MIDDHLGLQKGYFGPTRTRPAVTRCFRAGLCPRRPASLHAKVWGAEIEGLRGLVGPVKGPVVGAGKTFK